MPSLVEIGPVVLEKMKSLRTDRRRTTGDQKSSLELKKQSRFILLNYFFSNKKLSSQNNSPPFDNFMEFYRIGLIEIFI